MSAARQETFDVAVIGAGPAGTSAAAVLAEAGQRVAILEKNRFPRYRIGESLIPHCWYSLQRLGLVEKLDRARFMVRKFSVQFVSTEGKLSTPFYFREHSEHASSRTWQVVRSQFDQMLLDNALSKGATLLGQTAAKELIRENGSVVGVRARVSSGLVDIRARLTIDASGRDTFSQTANRWRVPDPVLRKIAIWSYFLGAERGEGRDEGATTVAYLPGKGWFWYIPLPGDRASVGVVADGDYLYREGRDPDAIFDREVAAQPWIAERLRPACKMEPCRVTGDYSFRSRHCSENGLVLTGDAFAFLDPVFSSGVYLALTSGIAVGDAACDALAANDVSAGRFESYAETLCNSIESMRQLVYAFYDQRFDFAAFLRAHPDMKHDLTECLIGNLEKDYTALFAAVGEFAEMPEKLTHGGPLFSS